MLQENSLQGVQTRVVAVEPKADVDPIVVVTVPRVVAARRLTFQISGELYTNHKMSFPRIGKDIL